MPGFTGNHFTRTFGIDLPLVQGPMGGATGSRLVAAVANAGGLGMLPIWTLRAEQVAREIDAIRALTPRPFGVNLRADLLQIAHVEAALASGVSIFHFFWGDPAASMAPLRAARNQQLRVMATVGDAAAAAAALAAGADALIAQGVEAGGHVIGSTPLRDLLAAVLPLAGDIPVLAAGGLATASDVAEVMSAGAAGALLGTRFVATAESIAHDDYKQALIEAGPDATARSECFDIGWPNAPHRNLRNSTFTAWDSAGRPPTGARPGEGDTVLRIGRHQVPRYSDIPPARGMTGDIRAAVLYAGTGVDRITDCPSAADLIAELAGGLPPAR